MKRARASARGRRRSVCWRSPHADYAQPTATTSSNGTQHATSPVSSRSGRNEDDGRQARLGLKKMPLCQRFMCELHGQLLTGVRGAEETPGEFRTIQNFIGQSDLVSARFVPLPPSALKPLLADPEQYLNLEDKEASTPLLVRVALSHYSGSRFRLVPRC